MSTRGLQWQCLHQGNGVETPPSPTLTEVGARFSPASALPQLAAASSPTSFDDATRVVSRESRGIEILPGPKNRGL